MIALDFKLTSGQVRALLRVYHGSTPVDTAPVLAFFQSPHWLTAKQSLERKGLIVHTPPEGGFQYGWERDPTLLTWQCTPAGRALAEMIVNEAHKIVALDISRRAFEERLEAHRAAKAAESAI